MKFGKLMAQSQPELEVSLRHDTWLKENGNPTYSKKALEFGMEQLALQAKPRDRRGTVSASSLESCRRRQQFTYLGMPELPPSPKTAQIFQNGTFMHVRWQMAGLTEGWMTEAEVPVPRPNELHLHGTRDGISHKGSVVELKSINSNGFRGVMTFGVKKAHLFQVGTYMVASGVDRAVVIYEDKDTQEYTEKVVHLDAALERDVREIAEIIWSLIADEILAEPLSGCEDKEGWVYNSCPFKDRCLKVRSWDHAEEIVNG